MSLRGTRRLCYSYESEPRTLPREYRRGMASRVKCHAARRPRASAPRRGNFAYRFVFRRNRGHRIFFRPSLIFYSSPFLFLLLSSYPVKILFSEFLESYLSLLLNFRSHWTLQFVIILSISEMRHVRETLFPRRSTLFSILLPFD